MHPDPVRRRNCLMTRIIPLLALTLPLFGLAACNGNTNHPVGAPTGIRAESGGGVQQLNRVPGVNATAPGAGVVSRTTIR